MDQVLYFVADPASVDSERARLALERAARRVAVLDAHRPSGASRNDAGARVRLETDATRLVLALVGATVDALVIDARGGGAGPALLRELFAEHGAGGAVGRERTWVVVDGGTRGAEAAFEAGRARLAGVVHAAAVASDEPLGVALWERLAPVLAGRRGGKIALCLAGGGTEGLFYELGTLRAISRFLRGVTITELDIVCGISAGAVLGSFLANGVTPEALVQGLRHGGGPIDPIRRVDLFDPNLRELGRRSASLTWDLLRLRRSPASALFRLAPSGLFAGDRLRAWLARQLGKPGMVDRFEELPRRLLVGATDQDSNEHVLFGAPGAPDVPIHVAVRASTALAPFYAPERIDGRYYVDGGFTRTTNMRVAVQHGATLVLLVDPLVPVTGAPPGYVAERGGFFGAMQGLKALVQGRFDKAVPALRAMYPHVDFHLFQPEGEILRRMSGSPMRYFYRAEIEELAYKETLASIRERRLPALARDFARHGVAFGEPEGEGEGIPAVA